MPDLKTSRLHRIVDGIPEKDRWNGKGDWSELAAEGDPESNLDTLYSKALGGVRRDIRRTQAEYPTDMPPKHVFDIDNLLNAIFGEVAVSPLRSKEDRLNSAWDAAKKKRKPKIQDVNFDFND